jgi:small ligand-binding sensory domain FIST
MPFAAALSTRNEPERALAEACNQAQHDLGGPPDLAVLFFSVHHVEAAEDLAEAAHRRLSPRALVGCVAESVIGNDREVETSPALVLWLARWIRPVQVETFQLVLERTADGPSLLGWPDALAGADPAQSALLLLGDPFSFPTELFLAQVNGEWPGLRVIGGMASGARRAGQCRLLHGDQAADAGAVGVLLQGPLGLRTIVSQGCRPIGRHLVITRAEDNVIYELGGRPPLEALREIWDTLTPKERRLLHQGLHVGRVLNEYQGEFQRGDFLVRNVLAVDKETGAMGITDRVRVGQTVQFHVRDAETADEDLHALLQLDLAAHTGKPAGALLFSCNGRGSRLFEEASHDARAIREETGPVPLAGFFAAGELGPVGGQNFIHGFTASVALFEE